jgi:hypothetical protein
MPGYRLPDPEDAIGRDATGMAAAGVAGSDSAHRTTRGVPEAYIASVGKALEAMIVPEDLDEARRLGRPLRLIVHIEASGRIVAATWLARSGRDDLDTAIERAALAARGAAPRPDLRDSCLVDGIEVRIPADQG